MTTRNAGPLCLNVGTTPEGNLRIVRRLATALLVTLLVGAMGLAGLGQVYSRQELIEDARQLLAILEDNHPDPVSYTHLRAHET